MDADQDSISKQSSPSRKSSINGCDDAVLETMEQLKVKTEESATSTNPTSQSSAPIQPLIGLSPNIDTKTSGLDSYAETKITESDSQDADSLCDADERDSKKEDEPAKLEESQKTPPLPQREIKISKEGVHLQPNILSPVAEKDQVQEPNPPNESTVTAKLPCKPVEKSTNPFILPKPSTSAESNSEKHLDHCHWVHHPASSSIHRLAVKPIAKKAIKPKLNPAKPGETTTSNSKKKVPPTMIINPMDCMTSTNQSNDPSPSSSNGNTSNNSNNMMMNAGMQNMIFPNQLALKTGLGSNGNFIAMPSYMQMPSSQPNGQPQFIPVMSSQIFLAMQQQQQQQSENNSAQASSANSSIGSKISRMPMMQPNVNGAMNVCSSMASSVVQPAQLMSASNSAGNQMFFRVSKNGMLMPTLVAPQNMAQARTNSSTAMPMQFNPTVSGAFFSQPQQQKFIQPKQVSSTSSNAANRLVTSSNDKLQKTSPSSQLAKMAPSTSSSAPMFGQQPVLTTQPAQQQHPQQFSHLTNSQLAASLEGSSSAMPRLVQITPSPISGSSLNSGGNQQQQIQNAWGIANFSMASSKPFCSSTQSIMPSLTTSSIFPQMVASAPSDGMTSEQKHLLPPPPLQKASKKRAKPGGGSTEEEDDASSREATGGAANDEEENEPPPLLCRGVYLDEFGKIENVFLREAALMHERCFDAHGNKKAPIK
uniref:Uncharacterized protein n=1 Tax=Ditylenchus dipsaci TaxID=166011 RepID=A0A915ETU1_9BILA